MSGTCVLISAGAEWRALTPRYPGIKKENTPFGECFTAPVNQHPVHFLHGGWGKVAAAASTQYAIDRWYPDRIVNLGTCGGFQGEIEQGAVVLAEKTVVYDIMDQMCDPDQAIVHYTVEQDLSWLPTPTPQLVQQGILASADRDLFPQAISELKSKYQAIAADWESGAIAWVAHQNHKPCLILRGVTDLVGPGDNVAYGNYRYFEEQCQPLMAAFAQYLPAWLEAFSKAQSPI